MAAGDGATGGGRRGAALSFAAYAVVLGVCAWPWLQVAAHSAPLGALVNAADEWLVPWILGWVGHALATDPRHFLDANINYPAPGQLTGIEHFLSSQLLFAPVFWTTGNAVLAANVVTRGASREAPLTAAGRP